MNQELNEWLLLLLRWLHIIVGVTWIGTSIFFIWLDRSFKKNVLSQREGHVGELWMVHGGGFYHVEKLLMGPTKVPDELHWFKWESYWTWMSGFTLLALIFYTGDGTFLLDASISNFTYGQAVALGLFSIFGSWFFYDFVWERNLTKNFPMIGHALTIFWFVMMDYILCHTLSGRAAYIHVGAMLGTWMTANVFMRIIPRQVKMVEASKRGEPVNQDWGVNAKNRSTHNTYFTLPVIFIMLSNHFPMTYGHQANWLVLLGMCAAGAAIREFFVSRINNPSRAKVFLAIGLVVIASVIFLSKEKTSEAPAPVAAAKTEAPVEPPKTAEVAPVASATSATTAVTSSITGTIFFEGVAPKGKKLNLPNGCNNTKGDVYSNEVMVNDGKLQNVLVRITKGLEGKTFSDIPAQSEKLDQRGCLYRPRVLAVRVGQKVDFINSDPVFHNIRSVTTQNKSFNVPMPKKDQTISMTFDKPEIFLQSKCSVHPWMGAYIAVMDHPYFFVTREDGKFEIKNLPSGKYTLEVWHEVFGTQTKEFEIKDSAAQVFDFKFSAK